MLSTTADFLCILIFLSTFFTRCAFTVETQSQIPAATSMKTALDQSINKITEKGSEINVNKVQQSPIEQTVSKPSNIEISNADPKHRVSSFASEGGGLPLQTSTLPVIDKVEITDVENHSKSVKGRKGVVYPKVSPRKGVDENELLHNNTSSTGSVPIQQSSTDLSSNAKILPTNKTTATEVEKISQGATHTGQKISHANYKKPEVVSDKEDDDFDGIIKTSTTGEDYIIIGIVIVIGIWFSVFGALIFYRRAGEYWDRRHYRRMDFLVEGMYND